MPSSSFKLAPFAIGAFALTASLSQGCTCSKSEPDEAATKQPNPVGSNLIKTRPLGSLKPPQLVARPVRVPIIHPSGALPAGGSPGQ